MEDKKGATPNHYVIMNVGRFKALGLAYRRLPEDGSFVYLELREIAEGLPIGPLAVERELDAFSDPGIDLLRKDPSRTWYYARGKQKLVEVRNRVDYSNSLRAKGSVDDLLAMGEELPQPNYSPRLSSVAKEPKSPELPPAPKIAGRVSPHMPKPIIKPTEPVMGSTPVKAPEGLLRKVEQNRKFFDGLVPPLDVKLGRRLWMLVKWRQGPVDWGKIQKERSGFDLLLGLAHLVNAGAFILRDDLTLELGNPKIQQINPGFVPPSTWVDISELAA